MDFQNRFRINRPEVVHEAFDGEFVAIHFESGNYYSLVGVAADIWALIDAGASLDDVVQGISARYSGSDADIERAVRGFVAELLQ